MPQNMTRPPTVAFSPMVTGREWISDTETQSSLNSRVEFSRVDSSNNSSSSSSWQTVVITTSSLAVLLMVAFISVCHLRQSAIATRLRNGMLRKFLLPKFHRETTPIPVLFFALWLCKREEAMFCLCMFLCL